MFLLTILIPAGASSSPAFHMMYSAYKLNKRVKIYSLRYSFRSLEPVHWPMSGSSSCLLTCIQVSQEADDVVSHSHVFKNFPQFVVIHTVKGFNIVNEAEVDIFLEFSCFFYDSTYVGILISSFSAFSKSSLYTWKFSVHVLLKPSLKDLGHYLASM